MTMPKRTMPISRTLVLTFLNEIVDAQRKYERKHLRDDGIQHILDDQIRTTGGEGKRRGDGHHAGYHTADDGETDDGCEVHYAIHKSFLVQLREVFIT